MTTETLHSLISTHSSELVEVLQSVSGLQVSVTNMAPEMRIPSHITALYVFAVVNLMALFHVSLVDANIIVVSPTFRCSRTELNLAF